jgi:hypothetical protein
MDEGAISVQPEELAEIFGVQIRYEAIKPGEDLTFVVGGLCLFSRWIEEGSVDRATKRFFKVRGSEGAIHRIYYDDGKLEWFLKTED